MQIHMDEPSTYKKIITIGPIPVDLKGFCITMATLLDFFKILFREDVLGPDRGLSVKFGRDPLRIDRGVRSQSHKYLVY